jgi:hypothetical protein
MFHYIHGAIRFRSARPRGGAGFPGVRKKLVKAVSCCMVACALITARGTASADEKAADAQRESLDDDSSGHAHAVNHQNDFGSLTYLNYGLAD